MAATLRRSRRRVRRRSRDTTLMTTTLPSSLARSLARFRARVARARRVLVCRLPSSSSLAPSRTCVYRVSWFIPSLSLGKLDRADLELVAQSQMEDKVQLYVPFHYSIRTLPYMTLYITLHDMPLHSFKRPVRLSTLGHVETNRRMKKKTARRGTSRQTEHTIKSPVQERILPNSSDGT